MKSNSTRFALILLVGMMIPIAPGCSEDSPVLGSSQSTFSAGLVLRDAAGEPSAEFGSGQPVTFELTVHNLTADPQRIVFPDSQTHDFEILDSAGGRVWNWAHDQNFLTVLTPVHFQPGESKVFTVTWHQTDNDGAPVEAGPYNAEGFLPANVPGVRAETVGLAILP